jgi:uncharacterized protein YdeI (BOF family)
MSNFLKGFFIINIVAYSILPLLTHAQGASAQTKLPVIINEFMPNPEGSDTDYEWIELYNWSENDIDLNSWELDGNIFSEELIMESKSYLIITKNKDALLARYPDLENIYELNISLKNSSDTIVLSDGINSDEITYEDSLEAVSWERISYCNNNFEYHSESNSIGVENENNDSSECEATLDFEIEISRDEENFDTNFSNFINSDTILRINYNSEITITEANWYIDNKPITQGEMAFVSFESEGTFDVLVEIKTDNENIYTQEVEIIIFPRILFNEIMPNPDGPDTGYEWIEFYSDSEYINMDNWVLEDATSSEYFSLFSDNYALLYPTLSLNNSNETLTLYTPTGLMSDSIAYENSVEDQSFSRVEDGYGNWTNDYQVTPGNPNMPKPTLEETLDLLTISNAKAVSLGEPVKVRGIVTSEKDQLGSNSFYIQDDTAGIKIYLSSAITDNINVEIGQELQIIGELKESRDEFQLYIEDSSKIQRLSSSSKVTPVSLSNDLELLEGSLIQVSGNISKTSGSSFYITTNNGETKVSILSSTEIENPDKKKGDYVEVTGVLSQWGTTSSGAPNYRILPRFNSDIKIIKQTTTTSSTNKKSSVQGEAVSISASSADVKLKPAKLYNSTVAQNPDGKNNVNEAFSLFWTLPLSTGSIGLYKDRKKFKLILKIAKSKSIEILKNV